MARRKGLSRSAFIRRSLELALGDQRIEELAEAERKAYAKRPPTADERSAQLALYEAQDRAMALLASEEEAP